MTAQRGHFERPDEGKPLACGNPNCRHPRDAHERPDSDGACSVGDPDVPWDCDCTEFRPQRGHFGRGGPR